MKLGFPLAVKYESVLCRCLPVAHDIKLASHRRTIVNVYGFKTFLYARTDIIVRSKMLFTRQFSHVYMSSC